MDAKENAIRDLLDALLCAKPALEKIDPARSIDENVRATGVEDRYVKAYLMGIRVVGNG